MVQGTRRKTQGTRESRKLSGGIKGTERLREIIEVALRLCGFARKFQRSLIHQEGDFFPGLSGILNLAAC